MALDFVAGWLGGCAGLVVGYPFDTIKVHIQTQDQNNPKYKGTWHCFRSLLARDSIGGLYKGMSSPIAGVALMNAIAFGVYGQSQKLLCGKNSTELQLSGHFIAGMSAGVAQSVICSPVELAKIQLQLQERQKSCNGSSRPVFSGPIQCLRQIHKTTGLRGVFKGLGITVLRDAPGCGVYFWSYEFLISSSDPHRNGRPVPTWYMMLAGGLAGTASWLVSYPLDVIKSRIQADTTAKYSGALDCFRKSLQSEGYGCLFRGLNSTIIRAFPMNATTFTVVAWTLRLLQQDHRQPQPQAQIQPQLQLQQQQQPQLQLLKPRLNFRSWDTQESNYVKTDSNSLHSLCDTTNSYLQHLANASLFFVQKAAVNETATTSRQFDEVNHFE